MCDGIIDIILKQKKTVSSPSKTVSLPIKIRRKPIIIATGGRAQFFMKYSKTIRRIDQDLTLKGIFLACT